MKKKILWKIFNVSCFVSSFKRDITHALLLISDLWCDLISEHYDASYEESCADLSVSCRYRAVCLFSPEISIQIQDVKLTFRRWPH